MSYTTPAIWEQRRNRKCQPATGNDAICPCTKARMQSRYFSAQCLSSNYPNHSCHQINGSPNRGFVLLLGNAKSCQQPPEQTQGHVRNTGLHQERSQHWVQIQSEYRTSLKPQSHTDLPRMRTGQNMVTTFILTRYFRIGYLASSAFVGTKILLAR